MEVTKTVRCNHMSDEADNFKKAKKMRSNEDLIDREETLEDRKCVVKVALSHLPFNEADDVMMENSTFTVKKDVELKKEYSSITAIDINE